MLFILIHILLSFSGLNLLSMNTTMLLWQQLFVVGISPAKKEVCKGVAMSLHYLILSTFFWTHIMAWDLYQGGIHKSCGHRRGRGVSEKTMSVHKGERVLEAGPRGQNILHTKYSTCCTVTL